MCLCFRVRLKLIGTRRVHNTQSVVDMNCEWWYSDLETAATHVSKAIAVGVSLGCSFEKVQYRVVRISDFVLVGILVS